MRQLIVLLRTQGEVKRVKSSVLSTAAFVVNGGYNEHLSNKPYMLYW